MHLVFEIQGIWAYDAKREKLAGTLAEGASVWLSREPHPKDDQAITVRLRGNSNAMLGYLPRVNIPEVSMRLIAGDTYEAKVTRLRMQKQRGASQLSCLIALTFSDSATAHVNKNGGIASLQQASKAGRCAKCDRFLAKTPILMVEDVAYCYRCAKQLVSRLDQERKNRALEKYNRMMEPYNEAKTDFEGTLAEWEECRLEAIKSTFWSDKVCGVFALLGAILGAAGGIQSFVWGGVIGFIMSLILHSQDQNRLLQNYRRSHPQPTFDHEQPTYPPVEPVNYFLLSPPPDDPILSREDILKRDGYACQSCGQRKKAEELEGHHVLPRSKNGPNTSGNLVTLCLHCHDREDWFGHVRAYPTTFPKRRPLPIRFRRFR